MNQISSVFGDLFIPLWFEFRPGLCEKAVSSFTSPQYFSRSLDSLTYNVNKNAPNDNIFNVEQTCSHVVAVVILYLQNCACARITSSHQSCSDISCMHVVIGNVSLQ